MSLALLFDYLMLNMFRMLIHPSSGACDLFVELFHELYCSGTMCVGVTVWFGWDGMVSGCRLKHGLIDPSSGACDLFVQLFHGLYCSVRIEVLALASLFSGEQLDVTCVVVLESVYLQILAAAVS